MPNTVPEDVRSYKRVDYWDARFQTEEEYEWLVTFDDVRQQLLQEHLLGSLGPQARILVIGCGNSSFSADMYDALAVARGGGALPAIVNVDFSQVVIDKMQEKYQSKQGMEWVVHDMRALADQFESGSVDLVIDKAGTDALATDEGDPWAPNQSVVNDMDAVCKGALRVLKPGGKLLSISFQQPHFRRKYLEGTHAKQAYDWESVTVQDIESTRSLPHFLYVATKRSSGS